MTGLYRKSRFQRKMNRLRQFDGRAVFSPRMVQNRFPQTLGTFIRLSQLFHPFMIAGTHFNGVFLIATGGFFAGAGSFQG